MLIEKVTGKPYGEYLAGQLFQPNGLRSTVYCDTKRLIPHRAHGYDRDPTRVARGKADGEGGTGGFTNTDFISMDLPFAAGSLCSTVGDLVAWTRQLSGGRVVAAASYREMTTPARLTTDVPMHYGFGLMPDTIGPYRVIAHGGGINGFISHLMAVPQDSLIIAVLANTSPAPSAQVADAMARVVLGLPARAAPAAPKDLATTPELRAALVGTYDVTFPDGTKHGVRIVDENGSLMFQPDDQPAVRMQSQDDNAFFIPGHGRVVFTMANGRATGFVIGGAGVRPLNGVRR
jgi:CubicO group peptidase (beta-lactamase class C family)